MTTPSFTLGIGDDWLLPVTYADPQGVPINLTGSVVGAELYFAYQATPILELTLQNGGLASIDYPNGKFIFFVPKAVTANATADKKNPTNYPNRLQVWVVDSLGHRETIAIFPILVFDPRTVDPSVFAQNQTGTITSAGSQGPAGSSASLSVNGHTGAVQTLTASDVGAYTTAQVDAAIAAIDDPFLDALIFGS